MIQDVKNKGNVSEFAPYIDYLYSKNNNDVPSIPSTWSSLGKQLLKTIHGPVLEPQDITDTSFFTSCLNNDGGIDYTKFDEDKRQPFEFAYATALSRSRDDKLVPLLDMFNHHGGDKFNVDSSTVHQQKGDDDNKDMKYTSEYINVYAKRDIHMGEQLYINYMECTDEYLRRHENHLSKLLRDHGFVEDYPQRWSIPTPVQRSHFGENNVPHEIIFDIIKVDDDAYEIKWEAPAEVPAYPTIFAHLQKELTRIEDIGIFVTETAGNLTSDHERTSCLKYYQSLMIAYKKAIASVEAAIESSPPIADDNNEVLAAFAGDQFMACNDFEQVFSETGGWYLLDEIRSFNQAIDYYYNEETEDACLFLDEYLHACASNRPHYHEVFVHYPAHFLDKVERVLFIGGGDSMVLHEVLKYNDQLKLVVGLELDQQVVRSTFSRIGTQPHFDKHEKVEWWFGDAAQTLNVLPTEYYGTFDLVIVDILSEVADSLEVNDEVTIMEAAMMLMKPNGIIVKNEDEGYVPGSTNSSKFTEHVVDVMYYDVPVYCLQTFVIGSNEIDFSKMKPVDHKVPTLYLKDADEFQPQFDTWYTSGIEEKEDCQEEKKVDDSSKDSVPTNQPFGMTIIIDADKITGVELDSISGLQQIISKSLTKIGFTEISAFDQELQDGYTLTFVLEEGFVTARCFPKKQYCAIDVQLWKSIHKAELAKKELIAAIGCEESSVYRVITSGVLGVEENDKNDKIGPPPKTNPQRKSTETCTSQSKDKKSSIESSFTKRKDPAVDFINATVHSYDSRAALEQYFSQDSIGEQSIVRYNIEAWDKKTRREMSTLLTGSLTRPLSFISDEWEKQDDQIKVTENEIGKGLVITVSWSEGNIVVVWDGYDRIDVNFFALNNSAEATYGVLAQSFGRQFGRPHASDDFPRGTGLIVNFQDEIPPRELGDKRRIPFWARK